MFNKKIKFFLPVACSSLIAGSCTISLISCSSSTDHFKPITEAELVKESDHGLANFSLNLTSEKNTGEIQAEIKTVFDGDSTTEAVFTANGSPVIDKNDKTKVNFQIGFKVHDDRVAVKQETIKFTITFKSINENGKEEWSHEIKGFKVFWDGWPLPENQMLYGNDIVFPGGDFHLQIASTPEFAHRPVDWKITDLEGKPFAHEIDYFDEKEISGKIGSDVITGSRFKVNADIKDTKKHYEKILTVGLMEPQDHYATAKFLEVDWGVHLQAVYKDFVGNIPDDKLSTLKVEAEDTTHEFPLTAHIEKGSESGYYNVVVDLINTTAEKSLMYGRSWDLMISIKDENDNNLIYANRPYQFRVFQTAVDFVCRFAISQPHIILPADGDPYYRKLASQIVAKPKNAQITSITTQISSSYTSYTPYETKGVYISHWEGKDDILDLANEPISSLQSGSDRSNIFYTTKISYTLNGEECNETFHLSYRPQNYVFRLKDNVLHLNRKLNKDNNVELSGFSKMIVDRNYVSTVDSLHVHVESLDFSNQYSANSTKLQIPILDSVVRFNPYDDSWYIGFESPKEIDQLSMQGEYNATINIKLEAGSFPGTWEGHMINIPVVLNNI